MWLTRNELLVRQTTDPQDLRAVVEDAFAQEKARGQFGIVARGSHRDRDGLCLASAHRAMGYAQFERLLDGKGVGKLDGSVGAYTDGRNHGGRSGMLLFGRAVACFDDPCADWTDVWRQFEQLQCFPRNHNFRIVPQTNRNAARLPMAIEKFIVSCGAREIKLCVVLNKNPANFTKPTRKMQ